MLFTDESRFCLTGGDGRINTEAWTLERDRFGGGGSVMGWGVVSQHHRTELVVIEGNLNTALQGRHPLPSYGTPHVVPSS